MEKVKESIEERETLDDYPPKWTRFGSKGRTVEYLRRTFDDGTLGEITLTRLLRIEPLLGVEQYGPPIFMSEPVVTCEIDEADEVVTAVRDSMDEYIEKRQHHGPSGRKKSTSFPSEPLLSLFQENGVSSRMYRARPDKVLKESSEYRFRLHDIDIKYDSLDSKIGDNADITLADYIEEGIVNPEKAADHLRVLRGFLETNEAAFDTAFELTIELINRLRDEGK